MSARLFISIAVTCLLWLPTATIGCAQSADSLRSRAERLLNAGEYDEARRLYRHLLDDAPADESVIDYARTFTEVGDYEEGLAALDALVRSSNRSAVVLQAKGRLLQAVGRREEAERAFVDALTQRRDLWSAAVDLAELFARTGRDRQALALNAAVYEQYKRGAFRTARDLATAGRASAALARFRDANEAFRTAHQVDPQYVPGVFEWAELFRRKFNDADARRTYGDALTVNPRHASSLVGLARATSDFERQEELAQQALAVNPNHTDAMNLLSGLRTLDGLYAEAEAFARRALDVNPASIASLAQLASAQYLRGDTAAYRDTEARVLDLDPEASDFYLAVVENASRRFRYGDAAAFAEAAVRVDPADPQARAELGAALLRLGRRDEARLHLETAFELDPYNLFASNSLTLLDTYEEFAVLESPHFRLLIHEDEKEVLGTLILETAEAGFDSLRQRYPYDPAGKILIEAYNDADDFAVRIAGVPHRGLLGVSFGDVVAVNTPRALTGEPYNWGRTLWHEIAHTMAIGVSASRVPRWFTEGLSVYEEGRGRPEWEREMELAFLSAFDRDLLLPLDEIDRGFTRPSYRGQVILSYFHAGQVIDYIVDSFGFDAVVEILRQLRAGTGQDVAVRAATGIGLAEMDRRFRERVRERRRRVASALEGMPDVLDSEEAGLTAESAATAEGPFFSRLRRGAEKLAGQDYGAAESAFRAAMDLYPHYVGPGNAYEGLAEVYRARGNRDALVEILEGYLRLAENEAAAALELAGIYEERGDAKAAAEMLERTLFVAPYDPLVRQRLADAYERLDRFEDSVRHRRAIVALEPSDKAGAYYRLARSLYESRNVSEAKRAVIRSLEVAPDYRDAQKLLLEIVRPGSN